jgi:uncharacterized protein YcbX
MIIGTIESIWRYPVKSLRFEALDETEIEPSGLRGDRTSAYVIRSHAHVREGKPLRGKENDRLHLVSDDSAVRALAAEQSVEIERRDGSRFFDDAPVSMLLDRWLESLSAHVGYAVEPLRFRPNFFVRAEPAFCENEAALTGRTLRLGGAVLRVRGPIERCVVTTYDQHGGESDPRILRFVAQQRGTHMGVYCDVVTPGIVHAGDVIASS